MPSPAQLVQEKTSIIDAMTYALYRCTPQMGQKQISELISQNLSRVTVLISIHARSHNHLGTAEQTTEPLRHTPMAEWLPLVRHNGPVFRRH